MDNISRGPRRARHAAAHRNNETPPSAAHAGLEGASEGDEDQHQHHRHHHHNHPPQRRRQVMHLTPDQPNDVNDASSSSGAAPPPNPFRLHRAMPHARLSMPEISDDSSSEPDLSLLGMTRGRQDHLPQRIESPQYEVHEQEQDHLEAEDTSIDDDLVDDEVAEEMGDEEDEEAVEGYQETLADPAALGLKEISNLGRFTVSSHKQGNGVEELRSDDLNLYWQSDGPQPHKLTVYFVKRVGIRDLRFYVNYTEDESYTPTNIIFKSGTSENNLIEFAHLTLDSPVGWQQVSLAGTGGGPDGNTLVSYVLQMQILENHQNGKDTHLRGIKIYAFDVESGQAPGRENNPVEDVVELMDTNAAAPVEDRGEGDVRLSGLARRLAETRVETGDAGLTIPDFMRDPEIR